MSHLIPCTSITRNAWFQWVGKLGRARNRFHPASQPSHSNERPVYNLTQGSHHVSLELHQRTERVLWGGRRTPGNRTDLHCQCVRLDVAPSTSLILRGRNVCKCASGLPYSRERNLYLLFQLFTCVFYLPGAARSHRLLVTG